MIAAPNLAATDNRAPGTLRSAVMGAPTTSRLLTAEILSIGSELTVGETRDTNAGELARSLSGLGVRVGRITALPDDLDSVADAFRAGLERADLVLSTGGLGPTPDDLTREAIAAVLDETPVVDPDLEAWLRELWARREMPFPSSNLKQAWLLPSARALPNPNGTAPGWLVETSAGRVIVAMPGPPREMRPMWIDHALPLLVERGLGTAMVARTLRLAGIGESQVAEVLGQEMLRAPDPEVATYARAEAVDVRISSHGDGATERVAAAEAEVMARLGDHVWANGDTTWSEAIGGLLEARGWSVALVEIGTGGSLSSLVGDVPWLRHREIVALDDGGGDLGDRARLVRERSGADVGLVARAVPRRGDTAVSIAIATPTGEHRERRLAFLDGAPGRLRAALVVAAVLHGALRRER